MRNPAVLALTLLTLGLSFGTVCYAVDADYGNQDSKWVQEDSEPATAPDHVSEINWFDFSAGIDEPQPLVAVFLNFALLCVAVYLLLRGAISRRLTGRKKSVEDALAEAAEMKESAERALATAKAKIESVDAEMKSIREDIEAAGRAEATRLVEDAKERAERISRDTQALIEQEITRLAGQIREEIVQGVLAEATRILKENIEKQDQDRLAEEFLENIGEITKSEATQ